MVPVWYHLGWSSPSGSDKTGPSRKWADHFKRAAKESPKQLSSGECSQPLSCFCGFFLRTESRSLKGLGLLLNSCFPLWPGTSMNPMNCLKICESLWLGSHHRLCFPNHEQGKISHILPGNPSPPHRPVPILVNTY